MLLLCFCVCSCCCCSWCCAMFLLLQFSFTCFLIMRNFVLEMFVCPWHVMFPWHVFDIPYFPYWKLLSALEHSGACVIDALHWAASHGEALVVRDLAYVMFLLLLFLHDLAWRSWSCVCNVFDGYSCPCSCYCCVILRNCSTFFDTTRIRCSLTHWPR